MKKIYLGLTIATGSVALVYQVLWQRYFSLLLGADARSNALLVAIFLLGLSCGYAFFGKLSKVYKSRRNFLRLYGYMEILIGAYAMVFPFWFKFFNQVVPGLVHGLTGQIFVTILLIFIPTFCMGATIPVMTTVLPSNGDEIATDHAKIYGLNTLGAMVGVWLGALVVLPYFGLALGMTLMGILNILFAILYVTNNLQGEIHKNDWVQEIRPENVLKDNSIYAIVFFSGLVVLGLEIVWFRIWSLTIGSSYLIFPMVLSIFVAGLGWGSLSLKGEVTLVRLKQTILWAILFLIGSYLVVPYLPYWISHWRILLVNLPPNYSIFYLLTFVMLAMVLLPALYMMGQLLPMAYSLLPKTGKNYGARCAMLYFFNTLGTFIGSLFLGYFLLNFININHIYVCLIVLMLGLWMFLYLEQFKKDLRLLIIPVGCISLLFIPWNRRFHEVGTFRDTQVKDYHFKGPLKMPLSNNLFLNDGPNTTVSVTTNADKSHSIMVNGKSDSSTAGDFATLSLLALYPYLYQQNAGPYRAAIIGLGTGMTAGILGSLEKTTLVDVIEISHEVKKANIFFKKYNYDLLNNNKISVHIEDAFSFFKKSASQYDIIISEPSNPWVNGIENLFTAYFYEMAFKRLSQTGIFAQWLHLYSLDRMSVATVIENMQKVFPFIRLFTTQNGDILMLASKDKLPVFPTRQNSNDPIMTEVLTKLSIDDINQLALLEVFTENEVFFVAKTHPTYIHDIDRPGLSKRAHKSFFLETTADLNALIDPYLARHIAHERGAAFQSLFLKTHHSDILNRLACSSNSDFIEAPLCLLGNQFMAMSEWTSQKEIPIKLNAYSVLRKHKLINKNNLAEMIADLDGPYITNSTREHMLRELVKDADYLKAEELIKKWNHENKFDAQEVEVWTDFITTWKEKQDLVLKKEYSQIK